MYFRNGCEITISLISEMYSFYSLLKKPLHLLLISSVVVLVHFLQLQAQPSTNFTLWNTAQASNLVSCSQLYYAPFSGDKHSVASTNQEVVVEENEEEDVEDIAYSDTSSSVKQFFILENLLASCIKARISHIELSVFTHASIPLFITHHCWKSGFAC